MNVTVKLNNGTVIYPSYEPARGRAEALIDFYSKQFHSWQIDAYIIKNDAGVVIAQEGQF